jgi:hypothetical protein
LLQTAAGESCFLKRMWIFISLWGIPHSATIGEVLKAMFSLGCGGFPTSPCVLLMSIQNPILFDACFIHKQHLAEKGWRCCIPLK